jgi:hypothetical protein
LARIQHDLCAAAARHAPTGVDSGRAQFGGLRDAFFAHEGKWAEPDSNQRYAVRREAWATVAARHLKLLVPLGRLL